MFIFNFVPLLNHYSSVKSLKHSGYYVVLKTNTSPHDCGMVLTIQFIGAPLIIKSFNTMLQFVEAHYKNVGHLFPIPTPFIQATRIGAARTLVPIPKPVGPATVKIFH